MRAKSVGTTVAISMLMFGSAIWGQPAIIDCEVTSRFDFELLQADIVRQFGNNIYLLGEGADNRVRMYTISLLDGKKESSGPFRAFWGFYTDGLALAIPESLNGKRQSFIYDLAKGSLTNTDLYDKLATLARGTVDNTFFYQNDIFFARTNFGKDERDSSYVSLLDIGSGKGKVIANGAPRGISPDKMHLLYTTLNRGGEVFVMNLQSGRIVKLAQIAYVAGGTPHVGFLTNELIYFSTEFDDENSPRLVIFNLEGRLVGEYRFDVGDAGREHFPLNVIFSKDLTKAVAEFQVGDRREVDLIDTIGFSRVVAAQNLIFGQASGLINDAQVRLRENPNLEAAVLATLTKGEKVAVLDRSGIRVNIGSSNEYWYRIRTERGTEGWAYGAYIDLAKDS